MLLVSLFACGACTPVSVTFTFGARDGELRETVVHDDGRGARTNKVALIDVRGVLIDSPRPGLLGEGPNPVDELVSRLCKAERDGRVKAVILRINSPGGSVTASDTMYREIRRFAAQSGKPVVVSVGEVCASGGYYIALAADEIIVQPTSITGSIGVIVPTINVSEGLRRIGVVARAVRSGDQKDLANPLEPMREEHYAVLQALVDEYYESFVSLVKDRRPGLARSELGRVTDGRVITGAEAVRVGLADAEGDVIDAFEAAKRLAGVELARMVKYHSASRRPRTPYAAAHAPDHAHPTDAAGVEINLLRLDLADPLTALGGGNAYYLWMPGGL